MGKTYSSDAFYLDDLLEMMVFSVFVEMLKKIGETRDRTRLLFAIVEDWTCTGSGRVRIGQDLDTYISACVYMRS